MTQRTFVVLCILGSLLASGCSSSRISTRETDLGRQKLARPGRIIIYDFAATRSDLPTWSAAATKYIDPLTPASPETLAIGRELGAQVAAQLVADIQEMGMPAVRAAGQPAPQINDVVLIGYFGSVDQGSAAQRVVLGFGEGEAELRTAVEAHVMTDRGLRLLGSGNVDSQGGKTPGVIVPIVVTAATANPVGLIIGGGLKAKGELTGDSTIEGSAKRTAKEIADELRTKFKEQGWI